MKNRALSSYDWIAAIFSGVLMAGSLPPWDVSQLAWIAWIPLLSRILPSDPLRFHAHPFLLGYIAGFTFWLATLYWLANVTLFGSLALIAYLSLFTGLWTLILSRLRTLLPQSNGISHVLVSLFGSSAWVTLEWCRGRLLGGFPWNQAGVSQYQNLLLIQIAEWTGALGISFVVIFVNIAFWLTARRLWRERFSPRSWRYEFTISILLVAICLCIGMRTLFKFRPCPSNIKIALVQPNIAQEIKYDAVSREDQLSILHNLTLLAAATKPDLILWPESALVDGPTYDVFTRTWLTDLSLKTKIPLLIGTLDRSQLSSASAGYLGRWDIEYYNSAILVQPGGILSDSYHKMHLVPFGEYVPFEKIMPWLRQLTPIPGSFAPGNRPVLLNFHGLRIGPAICFEDTFPDISRRFALQDADFLVNLTNDGWFKTSPGAAMHAANAVFRAVETRRPLVRCTNTGLSMIVDATGQITMKMNPFLQTVRTHSLSIRRGAPQTFYTRYGDWFPLLCALLTFAGLALGDGKIRSIKSSLS